MSCCALPESTGLLEAWRTGLEKEPAMRAFPRIAAHLLSERRASPAALAEIGKRAGIPNLEEALHRQSGTEWDRNGNLVGLGLTSRPTNHRYVTNGRVWYTWCALDTLVYPILLGHAATIDSRCHATGAPVHVEVSPDGVRLTEPVRAVVSLVPAVDLADVRANFCHQVHFFVSREAAQEWMKRHPEGTVLTVADAFALGRDWSQMFTRP